jgi:hypothetical protein
MNTLNNDYTHGQVLGAYMTIKTLQVPVYPTSHPKRTTNQRKQKRNPPITSFEYLPN